MRTWIMSTLGAAGVAGLGYGMIPSGEVYPLPSRDVEAKLRAMDLPSELQMDRYSNTSDIVVEGEPGRSVIWRMRERGQTVGWVEAEFDPVDDTHTRVDVDFRMSETGDAAQKAALINRQEFVKAVGIIAIHEAVDSTLEDRGYDKSGVNSRVAAYAVTHPSEVARFKTDLESLTDGAWRKSPGASQYEAERDVKRPEIGVAQRQYEAERAMRDASKPMLDPTRPSSRY